MREKLRTDSFRQRKSAQVQKTKGHNNVAVLSRFALKHTNAKGDIMLSLSNRQPTGLPLSLLLVAVATVGAGRVWGASLGRADRAPPPSTEMLRALHYIQSLSQQAAPVAKGNRQPRPREGEGPVEEGAGQQWLQAVLETLQETHPQSLSPALTGASRRRHRKYPLEQERGGWGNSLKRTNENAQDEQYTPQKLATLQSVFEELQKISSSKSRSENKRQGPSDYQEEEEEEEEEEGGDGDEDEEEDAERMRKMTLEDWDPLQAQMDDEEDEEADRGALSHEEEDEYDDLLVKRDSQSDGVGRQGAGQPDDLSSLVDFYVLSVLEKTEQQEAVRRATEREEEEEEEEEERGVASLSLLELVRLSEQLGLSPDQLLNLLKSTSNPLPQQAPPRTPARTPTHLQAPPRTPTRTPTHLQAPPQTPARTPTHLQAPPQMPYELKLHAANAPLASTHTRGHTHTHTHTHTSAGTHPGLLSSPHARPLEAPEDVLATAQILHLLGLPDPVPHQPPKPAPAPRGHPLDLLFSERSVDDPESDPEDESEAEDEDEDASPLERLLLEQGPEGQGLPPRSAGASGERRLELRALTHVLEDFLDQPGAMETRQRQPVDIADAEPDDTLQSILGLLRPEQKDSSETGRLS
ncbi:histone-lysine N-methyltransferase SETD1B [Alosa sapidissima]|uniref:histone-lysine N-methyltransferase SETD1B n=1 Tax=Alosa sapidissima TaxID=34773 RepID=UPI001C0A469D|nr:histone-lysine N-methyltransferase SETD1B [Alosa sapidissima]